MQINILQIPENYEQTLSDKIAQAMFLTFNEGRDINTTVKGGFSIPYGYPDEYDPNLQYYCEKYVTITDGQDAGQIVPEIFQWRNWGRQAQNFINVLDQLGYEVKKKEINE